MLEYNNKMLSDFDAYSPKLILGLRIFAVSSLTFLTVKKLIDIGLGFFLYLTNWGMVLTIILFSLILIQKPKAAKICVDLLPSVFLQNILITLLYLILLSHEIGSYTGLDLVYMIFAHSLPFVLTALELLFNQVEVHRKHILYAMAIQSCCVFLINMPYTLLRSELYPGLNFKNWFTFLSMVGSGIGFTVFGESAIFIKRRILKGRKAKIVKSS